MSMESINILLAGDFYPVYKTQDEVLAGLLGVSEVVGALRPLFNECDFGLVNLECPLTNRGKPIAKIGSNLRADPKIIRLLTYLGVKGVTLANNHIRDYGTKGVLDTLEICEANGLRTVGAGATLESARQPLIITVKGRKIGFLNVAEREFNSATKTSAGSNPFDLVDLLTSINAIRDQVDLLVVIVHGGLEQIHIPSPETVKTFRFIAEQGVSAIIRHHSHYIQSYEVWQGVPIFYGLGNLLSDSIYDSADWNTGLMVKLEIPRQGAPISTLYPVCQQKRNGCSLVVLPDEKKRGEILSEIEGYNQCLMNTELHLQQWREVLAEREDFYIELMLHSNWGLRLLRRLKLLPHIRPSLQNRNILLNLFRCDTHREVCIDLLNKMNGQQ